MVILIYFFQQNFSWNFFRACSDSVSVVCQHSDISYFNIVQSFINKYWRIQAVKNFFAILHSCKNSQFVDKTHNWIFGALNIIFFFCLFCFLRARLSKWDIIPFYWVYQFQKYLNFYRLSVSSAHIMFGPVKGNTQVLYKWHTVG